MVDIIELGVDDKLVSNNISDSGTSGLWGEKHAAVDKADDQIHIACSIAPTIGGCTAWGYLANEFKVEGSGEEWCSISSSIYYNGFIGSAVGGTAKITIKFIVEDLGTGETWDETQFEESLTDVYNRNDYSGTDIESVNVLLKAGRTYRATVEAKAETSSFGTGGALSDWGSKDDGSQYIDAKHYGFDFQG